MLNPTKCDTIANPVYGQVTVVEDLGYAFYDCFDRRPLQWRVCSDTGKWGPEITCMEGII